ncbi:hypothetical protein ACFSBG_04445 [Georgenia yuyongxinii]|nr:hypothetical protein [Georgenia yuyongxinii]
MFGLLQGDDGRPRLMELEAVEKNLYFDSAPSSVDRLADAVVTRAARPGA